MVEPKIGTGKKPKNSSRRLYTDEDGTDTVPIKFATLSDVKKTITKLEKLYKDGKRPHFRISQIAQVLEQRSRFMQGKKKENELAKKYTAFLKERTKKKTAQERKKLVFKFS
tara:strand:- start:154 stop:489 length:336 start_codon:yes stop_codon:yes gene_type:complete